VEGTKKENVKAARVGRLHRKGLERAQGEREFRSPSKSPAKKTKPRLNAKKRCRKSFKKEGGRGNGSIEQERVQGVYRNRGHQRGEGREKGNSQAAGVLE